MTQPLEADLHAYVDGRLDAGRRAEVEAWLAGDAGASLRVAEWRQQKEALHCHFDPVLEETVPLRLRDGAVRRRPAYLALAAAVAWLTIGASAGYLLRGQGTGPGVPAVAGLARQAALAHAVYAPEVRHPVEVGAEQEAHLVQWLSKRLGVALRAPDLQAAGFRLIGGRLLPGEGGPAAQFMYQDAGGRRVTLYVRTRVAGSAETAFRYAREGSVAAFYWVDRSAGYALSGELAREELLRLAEAAYRGLEGGEGQGRQGPAG